MVTLSKDIVKCRWSSTKSARRGTQSKARGRGSKGSSRGACTVKALPLFDIAEGVEEVVETVSESVPTVAQDVLDAYQSSVSSSIEGSASGADSLVSALPTDSPAFAAGLVAVVIGGPLLAFAFRGSTSAEVVSAAKAIDLLSSYENSVLIDLRPKSVVKESGSPDIRSTSGKVIKNPLSEEDEIDVEKYESTMEKAGIVVLLDTYEGVSKKVGDALAVAGYKNVAIVSGGAEGPSGWRTSGLPWKEPFSFGIPGIDALQDKATELASNYKENPTAGNAALALFGTVGLGSFVFTEYEGIIEVLGLFVVGSFLAKKVLFYEDRKKTFKQIDDFLRDKKAPQDFIEEVEDFKGQIAVTSQEKPEVVAEKAVAEKAVAEKAPAEKAPAEKAPAEAEGEAKEEKSKKMSDQEEVDQWIQKWKERTSAIKKEPVPSHSS